MSFKISQNLRGFQIICINIKQRNKECSPNIVLKGKEYEWKRMTIVASWLKEQCSQASRPKEGSRSWGMAVGLWGQYSYMWKGPVLGTIK